MSHHAETFQFQAETRQLLDLVVHSLYTNKDIFLRELISNASDALDRLRFEAITTPDLMGGHDTLEIRLEVDRERRTLTVSDTGIGMSHDEVIANIGTIAKSGTRELREQVEQSGSAEAAAGLIGQFGVGFYSAFMVADRVTLVTRRAGEQTATRWESSGDGSYTLGDAEKSGRGTTITLELKAADAENGIHDYADRWTLERVVKQHSDFIAYPIVLEVEREQVERDEDGAPKAGGSKTTVREDSVLNSRKPIWTRSQSEVADEEYNEFYKHIAHDWTDPLKVVALKAEGRLEYRALLFVPSNRAFDLFGGSAEYGLRLYAKGVLVMERCEAILPRYLRFVKGVVDSADLPLNISRQTLQQDWQIAQIRKGVTKKVLDTLHALGENDPEAYLKFWEPFGSVLKEGVSSERENRERLVPLLLFQSSNDAEGLTTLGQYVGRMKQGQNEIYYLAGESRPVLENSPHLEAFRERGYEVLYLVEPVDEFAVQALGEVEGKKLRSAAKGSLALGSDEERERSRKQLEEKEAAQAEFLKYLAKELDGDVKEVHLSNRLTTSAACLVSAEYEMSPHLERLMQRARGETARRRRILELNPEHQLVKAMNERYQNDAADPTLAKYAALLLGQALLAEGSGLPDPVRFTQLVTELMTDRL
jgi:molecular chaperone HtpG